MGERGPDRTYRPDMRAPTIHGEHPPGIATPQLEHGLVAAYDVDVRQVLEAWIATAEAMMRGGSMTVTIGLGPGVFDPTTRPVALRELPAFPGDALDAARCGGDLCVMVSSKTPVDPPFPNPRWVQRGTNRRIGRLGFRDGTAVPRRPLDLDRHVWVTGRDRSWMIGGTYVVVRDIAVLDSFTRLPEPEQERIIGRHKSSGAALGRRHEFEKPDLDQLAEDSHVRVASPDGKTLLRRGYDTEDGLLLLAFQRDPRRQFVPLQQRLAERDALHPLTRARGSAVFAIPPGPALKTLYAQ